MAESTADRQGRFEHATLLVHTYHASTVFSAVQDQRCHIDDVRELIEAVKASTLAKEETQTCVSCWPLGRLLTQARIVCQ